MTDSINLSLSQNEGSFAHMATELTRSIVEQYKEDCAVCEEPYDFRALSSMLKSTINGAIAERNEELPRGMKPLKWSFIRDLPPFVITEIIMELYVVTNVSLVGRPGESTTHTADAGSCPLAIYCEDPNSPHCGTYAMSEDEIARIVLQLEPSATTRDINQVKANLKSEASTQHVCRTPQYVAVNNGIFNFATKELEPFTPDLVFLTKIPVDYNKDAKLVYIDDDRCEGGRWDVESWMSGLNDNPEVVDVLWNTLAAAVRPNAQWDKAVFLYATRGCNGKGTFCSLMQSLVGPGAVAYLNLDQMNDPFFLESIVGATLIYGDENDVGRYIDGSSTFKSLVTGDTVVVNRKHKSVVPVSFCGLVVQCCNEKPRIRDRTDSLTRRIVLVPFDKSFAGEKENKDIKHDYLRRKEVLEYVLHKVLNMEVAEIGGCAATDDLMKEFRLENSSVRQFVDEFMDQFVWDKVPMKFAYDLYVSWNARVNGGKNATTLSWNNFKKELAELFKGGEIPGWQLSDASCRFVSEKGTVTSAVADPEPLITEYNLLDWKNLNGSNTNPDKVNRPAFKQTYRSVMVRI